MLKYLTDWLVTHNGRAPVRVIYRGGMDEVRLTLRGLDEIGVVLSGESGGNGTAFPWWAIERITPNHSAD